MKFETIKAKAKDLLSGNFRDFDASGFSPLLKGTHPSFSALLPFVLAAKDEREEMRAFAEAFDNKRDDWMAARAKSAAGFDAAWNQLVLQTREAGMQLIENWDVRKVGKLIELFPGCVPAKYRGKQLTCYMADDEDCDWMVEVNQPAPRLESLRDRAGVDALAQMALEKNVFEIGGIKFAAVRTEFPRPHWRFRLEETGEVFDSGTGGISNVSIPKMKADIQNLLDRISKGDVVDFRRRFGLPAEAVQAPIVQDTFGDKKVSQLSNAIDALKLAKESGGELDHDIYAQALDGLIALRDKILRHDQKLNANEDAPTGDDYNQLFESLGLQDLQPTPTVQEDRIAALASLRDRAGVAYTLHQVATKALAGAAGDASGVDWSAVDLEVIKTSMGTNKQDAQQVRDVLLAHSPGTATPEGLQAMLAAVDRVAPTEKGAYFIAATQWRPGSQDVWVETNAKTLDGAKSLAAKLPRGLATSVRVAVVNAQGEYEVLATLSDSSAITRRRPVWTDHAVGKQVESGPSGP